MTNIKIELQIAIDDQTQIIPSKKDFENWLAMAAQQMPPPYSNNEICIRIIDEQESQQLNQTYRNRSGPTNILSFAYVQDEEDNILIDRTSDFHLLGDLAICAPLVAKEASEQNKTLSAHWAHLVIHGYLHLIGYEHQTKNEAEKMEQLEIAILQELGYPNPYAII